MFTVNITYPGSWLEVSDPKKAHKIQGYLFVMETSLTDLAITLTMFCASRRTHKIQGIPEGYKQRIPFIYARSFSYVADTFSKFLSVVAEETGFDHVKQLQDELETKFPMLRKVVNSARHIEDRIRGYGAYKKKMDLKPIDNNFMKAASGAMITEALNGDKFGNIVDDGSYQEFEISQNTLEYMVELFQRLINGFQWIGPAQPTIYSLMR